MALELRPSDGGLSASELNVHTAPHDATIEVSEERDPRSRMNVPSVLVAGAVALPSVPKMGGTRTLTIARHSCHML